ncbi:MULTISPECIES: PhzF family phenazine biosynthesis protein [unclassified Polaromonas]|jgi:PhzF family phenazine biosynthesis protein|uniref:PhzF family phenazine biosynthesis protein n=1 Tax=unclassified Polaromonas TaxID=2638319 RepID=UPI000BC7A3D3|nr:MULTISPECIES: PhzF family phenazine biosynthesis protein [unclassified Polaromonas]OYY34327.1 MAG: phenazine biosynthesis protein PhzF [Polaromonas sp. 35-63-35]OYZ17827.1 MAG: phenazine biosynthesis protein PhzF [Polaromonas sp. 16-63-31]OYZ77225.1 MAG: phenazine biosynthesis protein PhzF [Polaromonas sp. 24-63-21]OZA48157.1 MAG: phenazine biosynthesis protein PhzF [Polaromonas sp. 17-63-33]OZA86683.1 MAG: phenazine biosynthesis protein PhzF [Polaromonas sp. 39-63-25]
MKTRPFKQVDVFTDQPYFGNPLAVVLDGSGLDDEAMQRFARWTNLSETTFVLPPADPAADYRVRIFTPGGELPFAGHPTLGSCHAWLQAGGTPKRQDFIVQECQVGLVNIRREGARLAFAAPPLQRSAPSPAVLAQVAAALGLKAQHILAAQLLDNGPVWLGLLLDSADTVLQLQPDHAVLKKHGLKVGIAGAHQAQTAPVLIARANREARAFSGSTPTGPAETATADFEVRAFAAPIGIEEDPVTGSLNASLAQWLIAEGHAPERYVAAQGTCLGRAGRVYLTRETDTRGSAQVWVGGPSVTCINGTVTL